MADLVRQKTIEGISLSEMNLTEADEIVVGIKG